MVQCKRKYLTRHVLMPKLYKLVLIILLSSFQISRAQITVNQPNDTVGVNNVYELNIIHLHSYPNNWEDVSVTASFNGPLNISVDGFYFDTGLWKVRFAPPQSGRWHYALKFRTPDTTYIDTGSFLSIPSSTKGFLQRHPSNSFRLIYPDGTLFNAIGFEDCIQDFNGNGTPLDDFGFDGGSGSDYKFTDLANYMKAYGSNGAKFNLFRWTTNNCSFQLYDSISTKGNAYLTLQGKFGDTLVRTLRNNNIRLWLTFFGTPLFNDISESDVSKTNAIEKYIKYVVARYGAYADIWELFNESSASEYYYNTITNYIKSIDPYKRLISVSDERPQLEGIDINSPHWYQRESVYDSDLDAYNMITARKSYNKPIIFGEQGNSVQNWDTLSSIRMRLRAWTSFFSEGTLIFWNTSYTKDYKQTIAANIYLGPTERSYIKSLQNFTSIVDSSAVIMNLSPANSFAVRAYGLNTSKMIFGYFSHYNSHAESVTTTFNVFLKRNATIYWIDPATNLVLDSNKVSFGMQTISSPSFFVDMAMRISLSDEQPVFDETKKLTLIVYPNPASSAFSIFGNFNGTATLKLYDLNGKLVLIVPEVVNNQSINILSLNNGVYIYNIKAGNGNSSGKLMVKK